MRFPLLCALLPLCVVVHAAPVDSLIQATDLLKINRLADPELSPDGKSVAYTVRSLEAAQPSGDFVYRNRLWLAAAAGDATPRELSLAGANVHDPAWHPSGDRLAFARPENDTHARIWVLPIAGGEPYAVTPPLRGAAAPRWSPDGTRLLFTAVVTYAEAQAALPADAGPATPPWSLATVPAAPREAAAPASTSKDKDKKKPAPPTPDPDGTFAARLAWLEANAARGEPSVTNRLNLNARPGADDGPKFVHIFSIERAGAAPVDLTPGFHSRLHPAWLPDSRRIVCSGPVDETLHPDQPQPRQLLILNADGGEPRPLLKSVAFSLRHPVASPDGKFVACLAQPAVEAADLSYGQTRVAVVDLDGPDPQLRILTNKLDRSADLPRWSPDGKFIYFTAETNGAAPLHRVPVSGGNPERISAVDTWVTAHSIGPDDLALVVSRANNPGELYRLSPAGRSARILTAHNSEWLRDKKLASPERRKLKRPDGVEVEYWVVKPPYLEGGFHYPLLLMIHGGPASMWGAANPEVWHELQYFAARGYGVVFANPRGSSGYGHKFQRASFQNWGPGPAGDVLAAADAIVKENWTDDDRQVVLGGSYGAYLAAWIVSNDSRFKAAIVARGVYDLTTFFGEGDAWPLVPWHFGGYPWQPEIRKLLDAQSPLTRVDSIQTPLLIKQNDADRQTGTAQGELLYRSLKLLGRPVEFVRYPRASHYLSRDGDPAQRIDRLVRFDAFFQRFIGTPAQPIPPPPPPTPPPPPPPVPVSAPSPAPAPIDAPASPPSPAIPPKTDSTTEGMMMMTP